MAQVGLCTAAHYTQNPDATCLLQHACYSICHQIAHVVYHDWLSVPLLGAPEQSSGCLPYLTKPIYCNACCQSSSTCTHNSLPSPSPVPHTLIMSHCMSNACYKLVGTAVGFVTSNSKAALQA